ncbi:hypothetical protein [Streptomyces globisporus]|uniref:hypothetical protein n=1 Tax=Streptomyces globisporus TaxID=1908 RepID=UPI0004C90218|nr:hypothetical protein [Streptomyces globisporus]
MAKTALGVALARPVVALGACPVGPGGWARSARATSERTADSAARWADTHGLHTGRVGTWTADHRQWLTTGVLLLLALVAATGRRSQAAKPSAPAGPVVSR